MVFDAATLTTVSPIKAAVDDVVSSVTFSIVNSVEVSGAIFVLCRSINQEEHGQDGIEDVASNHDATFQAKARYVKGQGFGC